MAMIPASCRIIGDPMAEPRLVIRSAKARALAHRLARREMTSIADVVERALEACEVEQAALGPAWSFYSRLSADYGTDIDLESVIRQARRIDKGPKL